MSRGRALLIFTIIFHDHLISLIDLCDNVTTETKYVNLSSRMILILEYIFSGTLGRDISTLHLCLAALVLGNFSADCRLLVFAIEEAVSDETTYNNDTNDHRDNDYCYHIVQFLLFYLSDDGACVCDNYGMLMGIVYDNNFRFFWFGIHDLSLSTESGGRPGHHCLGFRGCNLCVENRRANVNGFLSEFLDQGLLNLVDTTEFSKRLRGILYDLEIYND